MTLTLTCGNCQKPCGTKKDPGRLARGSKRFQSHVYCASCWNGMMRLTAAIIPVDSAEGISWAEFCSILREMWIQSTAASNYVMSALWLRDKPLESDGKMPKMEPSYLYPELRHRFPDLTPQSVTSIEQAVTAKYRKLRYEIRGTHQAAVASYRYPTPFPVHNQSWDCRVEDGKPLVSARIGNQRVTLRLKAGHQHRRAIEVMKQIEGGAALAGELALYRVTKRKKILCKMVAWIPRQSGAEKSGIMFVKTGLHHFLVAQCSRDAEDESWYLNADHIRRWVREYDIRLERLRNDRKAEQRPIPSFAKRQEIIVEKQRRRMKSAVQEIAAQLVNYATRRKVATLEYNDTDRIEESFPWFQIAARIEQKCKEAGIDYVYKGASDSMVRNGAESLAGGQVQ